MYSSALSQPGDSLESQGDTGRVTPEGEHSEAEEAAAAVCLRTSAGISANVTANANDMLCTSQTLDTVPLTPVVVTAPQPSVSAR